MSSNITPANIWRRVYANSLDTIIAIAIIFIVSLVQKDSPPPTGMSFYTQQQFENYFMLVLVACVIVIVNGLLMIYSPSNRTIGQQIFGLSLIGLDGSAGTKEQVLSRVIRTLGSVLFICIPGPVIALVIAIVVGSVFSVPFSNGDQMLIEAGVSNAIRYTLHAISYLALLYATWMILIWPLIKFLTGLKDGITSRDRATQSTYVRLQ